MAIIRALWPWLSGRAYFLLTLTALGWAGNAVAGRLAVGEISPMALTALRWIVVVIVLAVLVGRQTLAEWPTIAAHWRSILAMGSLGFTVFNALFYVAAHHTTGVNIAIIQGSMPAMVLIGGLLAFRTPVRLVQVVGLGVTLVGVGLVAMKGDLATLRTLGFNTGDLWMLIACVFYAGYTVALRRRPNLPALVFFTALAGAACLTTLPLLVYEIAVGTVQWPTPKGLAILLYAGLYPSLLSQVLFLRAVELIGPGRAGLFMNLVPVFGALLAVVILGEPFALSHAAALALVLGEIWLAERR